MVLPKQKGDTALGKAISYFLSNAYEVCLPIGDKRKYDLLVEKDSIIYRVQVKYAGLYSSKKTCRVALRVMGGNQSYHYAKSYEQDDFDFLFVYTAKNDEFLLPWNEINLRNEISIEAPKYSAYKITSRVSEAVKHERL